MLYANERNLKLFADYPRSLQTTPGLSTRNDPPLPAGVCAFAAHGKSKVQSNKKVQDYLLARTVNTTFIVALNNARTGISSSFEPVPSVASKISRIFKKSTAPSLGTFFLFSFWLDFLWSSFCFRLRACTKHDDSPVPPPPPLFFFAFGIVLLCFYFVGGPVPAGLL